MKGRTDRNRYRRNRTIAKETSALFNYFLRNYKQFLNQLSKGNASLDCNYFVPMRSESYKWCFLVKLNNKGDVMDHLPLKILHEFLSFWFLIPFSILRCPTFSEYKFWVLLFVSRLLAKTSNSDPKSFTYGTESLASHYPVVQCFMRIC